MILSFRSILNIGSGILSVLVYVTLLIELIFMLTMSSFKLFDDVHYFIFLLLDGKINSYVGVFNVGNDINSPYVAIPKSIALSSTSGIPGSFMTAIVKSFSIIDSIFDLK